MLSSELPALGPFVLESRIASGGMGEVWRAYHRALDRRVAVKVLDPQRRPTTRAIEAIHREVHAIARLDHEGIVRIHDYGELPHSVDAPAVHWNHGAPYFVMEYAAGGALHQIAHSLSWPQIRELLLSILSALAHAHSRGVIHRDLKPSNILLRQGPFALDDIMISDFGLAYALRKQDQEEPPHPRQTFLVGTPAYMAPEQIQHAVRDLGPWTDLYALGCMAWQLICGSPPFGLHDQEDVLRSHLHDPLPDWRPRIPVPDGLHAWMRSLLAKAPHDRFAFASEAARALKLLDHVGDTILGLSEHERSVPLPERTHFHDAGLGLYELKPVPLVGRTRERAAMWRAFESVIATQSPHLVVLRGEAGVGKSRLAQWLVERGHELGAALSLQAFHEPNPQAMEVLRRMLDRELRVAGLNRRDLRKRIKNYVHRWSLHDDTEETIEQDVRVLTQLTSSPTKSANQTPMAPSWQERQSTWLRLLRRMTHRKALIIWIDDVQWASDMLSLAEVLITRGKELGLPVLVIATLRPDALPEHSIQAQQLRGLIQAAQGAVEDLDIGPLSALEHEGLIRQILPLSTPLIERVVNRTQGNPLFTIQLIGDWVQRGALRPGSRSLELVPETPPSMPEDIHQLWQSRVEQLLATRPDDADDVMCALQAAAVLGREVDRDEWLALVEYFALEHASELLEEMIRDRLAFMTDVGWCFQHEMLRESLMWMARSAHRLDSLHRVAAKMLHAHYDTKSPRIAERLAYHLIEAGRFAEALPLLLDSLHHFRVVGEFFRARHVVRRWEHAVEQLRLPHGDAMWIEGLLATVQLHVTQGALDLAEAQLERAARHAQMSEESTAQIDVALVRARLWRKRGESAHALEALQRAFSLLELAEEELAWRAEQEEESRRLETLRARAMMAHGEVLSSLGKFEQARTELIEAIGHFKRMSVRREELGRGLLVLSEVLYNQQEVELSEELLAEAIGQFTRQNNQIALAYCHNFQGDIARKEGHDTQARAHYIKARALLHALGSQEAVFPSLNLILLEVGGSRYEEAMRYIPGVRRAFEAQGQEAYVGMVDLAEACVRWEDTPLQSVTLITRAMHRIDEAGVIDPDIVELCTRLLDLTRHDASARDVHDALRAFTSSHETKLTPASEEIED